MSQKIETAEQMYRFAGALVDHAATLVTDPGGNAWQIWREWPKTYMAPLGNQEWCEEIEPETGEWAEVLTLPLEVVWPR